MWPDVIVIFDTHKKLWIWIGSSTSSTAIIALKIVSCGFLEDKNVKGYQQWEWHINSNKNSFGTMLPKQFKILLLYMFKTIFMHLIPCTEWCIEGDEKKAN
jgi:hypothetical protein